MITFLYLVNNVFLASLYSSCRITLLFSRKCFSMSRFKTLSLVGSPETSIDNNMAFSYKFSMKSSISEVSSSIPTIFSISDLERDVYFMRMLGSSNEYACTFPFTSNLISIGSYFLFLVFRV